MRPGVIFMLSFNDKKSNIYQQLYFVTQLSRNTVSLNVKVQVGKEEVKSV